MFAPGALCAWCRQIVAVAAPPAAGRRGAVGTEATSQASLECPRPAIIATGVAATREGAGGPPPVPTAPVATIADPAPTTATHGPALRLPVASPSAKAQHGVGSASTPAGETETPSLENGGHGTDMTLVDRPGRGDAPLGYAPAPGPPSLFGARSTDPDTAHEAAAAVTDVQRRNVYRAVLEALVEHGPSTDHDLARYVTGKLGHPIGQTSAGKRRGELRDAGFVCDSGHKGIVRETGAKAIRWALTPAGIDAVGVAA